VLPGLGEVLAKVNPEVAFCDQDRKGYAVLTINREQLTAEFIAVSTVLNKTFTRTVVARYQKEAGTNKKLQQL
jgi:alkaline phosphatase D